MKYYEFVEKQNESLIDLYNFIEELNSFEYNFDSCILDENKINEKLPKIPKIPPLMKFVKIKNNLKKLIKLHIDYEMEDIKFAKMKHSAKWDDMDNTKKDVANKAFDKGKEIKKNNLDNVLARIDQLSSGNSKLEKIASYGKLKAKQKANKEIISKASGVLSKTMVNKLKDKQKNLNNKATKQQAKTKEIINDLEKQNQNQDQNKEKK